ncbi:hypothetical protein NQ314_017087 [Rhamnusium bicolor]|uniref:Peptidase M14 domain-containing protein n=1 Tax=Rhamnusium bicolor TaxID=1586634 RepID=A0AAV8WV74_9CUCU|nr:hypothetical protein NQ314_017087 [Rhamnusium bicolor]
MSIGNLFRLFYKISCPKDNVLLLLFCFRTTEDPDQQMTYTLSFTVTFPHDDDEVYLAHCYPYTYADLQDYLSELSSHPIKSSYSTVRLLCKSLAVITARVHPGETPSSWIMKGILDFLTGDSGPAKELRDKFIFKIVPMLNPDGVIVGNNRCSLSAKDLNRQYRTVIRDAYPSIWYTKLMVRRLLEECGVAMYCDLHAHSRKHNIFIYGCENRRRTDQRLQEQVFPLMLHKNTADKFSFESCKFRIQKAKEGTGRIVMWMMGIANSYTMEASFSGSTLGNRAETHFNTQDYEQMGRSFCQTLLDFYDDDPRKEKLRNKIIERLTKEGSNADEPTNIRLSDYSSDEGDTSSSSDEVGRDDDIVIPSVPPPSPAAEIKKPKPKSSPSLKTKIHAKSPSIKRKPLPICKATLKLSLSEKESIDSSSSDSESETENIRPIQDYSDSEVLLCKSQRSISVFDLIPSESIETQICTRRSKTPQPRTITEKKCTITNQLTEVQAKLSTLKTKIWFGMGNGDAPISWGNGNLFFPNGRSGSPQKKTQTTKKQKKQDKSEKKNNKETKPKLEQKEKASKNQNGYNIITLKFPSVAQIAVDWSQDERLKIRKSKSLPDTSNSDLVRDKNNIAVSGDDGKRERKKKKKRGKFVKKAKIVSNAKTFTRKD